MPSCNYWVFREGRGAVAGETLRDGLVAALERLRPGGSSALEDALLRAGEMETALADAGAEQPAAALITGAMAGAITGQSRGRSESLASIASGLQVPATLNVSTPEGFSYYALHPLSYSDLVDRLELQTRCAAVIGIRSIGTTLSAVVTAALSRRKLEAERITVRPAGHPYDRKTEFTPAQLRWIAARRSREAEFLVVDEGPGLSGSSFLSVGDALLEAGVERRRIHFLCSRLPDPEGLAAPDAAQRWRGFQSHYVSDRIRGLPEPAEIYCGGGNWRSWQYKSEASWPASWTQMERVKYLSRDRKRLFKFAGYGRFGAAIEERARPLAERSFGPSISGLSGGFAEYAVVEGRPAEAADLSRAVIERIADYCAWRAVEFRVRPKPSRLGEMVRFNLGEMLGHDAPECPELDEPVHAALCDAHMQPYEWILRDGLPIKTDGESHGDDHFFPGPCDIAWDLAGAAVEWHMNPDAIDAMLRRYQLRSGDDARPRFLAYRLGYAAFRAAYYAMAAFAMRGTAEADRLSHASEAYKSVIFTRNFESRTSRSVPSALIPIADTI